MSNIAKAFASGKAFIPFITCGDPDLVTTEQAVRAMTKAGADLIELGIPTVVDADPRAGLFLTPRDIDQRIRELGRLLGYGITLALQPSLTAADVTALLG